MAAHSEPLPAKKRLDSWKEIAAFFDRDERTVRRWEKERGLPVRRVPGGGRGGVFAYSEELREWLKGRASELESSEHEPLRGVPQDHDNKNAKSPESENLGRVAASAPTSRPDMLTNPRPALLPPKQTLARVVIWLGPLLVVAALIAVFSLSRPETRYKKALAAPHAG